MKIMFNGSQFLGRNNNIVMNDGLRITKGMQNTIKQLPKSQLTQEMKGIVSEMRDKIVQYSR